MIGSLVIHVMVMGSMMHPWFLMMWRTPLLMVNLMAYMQGLGEVLGPKIDGLKVLVLLMKTMWSFVGLWGLGTHRDGPRA